jgi:hypothetical protein
MKWFILGIFLAGPLLASSSKIAPAFLEAARIYVAGAPGRLVLRPDIRAALAVLEERNVDPALLARYTEGKSGAVPLRGDDTYDAWVRDARRRPATPGPELAVHAVKLRVVEESDDWLKDDVYAYFFVTDGVIPTGRVSSIYKGLSAGQSFFFNEIDRAIFPLVGVPAKRPENHLIIDYGIVESDGDDVRDLQKLSAIIIDLAIAVYTSYDPQTAQVLLNLRKEIKALAELLLSLNNDDRLTTGTIAYKVAELDELLRDRTFVEVTRKHKSDPDDFSAWDYRLTFRFLRR